MIVKPSHHSKQKGSALIFVMLAVSALSYPLSSSLKQAWFEEKMISNTESSLQARAYAENGLKTALSTLLASLNNGQTLESLFTSNDGILVKDLAGDGSGYSVSLSDNDNNDPISRQEQSVLLTATGYYGNASRVLESIVLVQSTKSSNALNTALLINGSLTLSGNSDITGSCGALHTNGRLTVSGSTYVNVSVSSSSGINNPEKLDSPSIDESASTIEVPEISPENYRSLADYILTSNGDVYDQVGNLLASTEHGDTWNGWQKTGENQGIASWQLSGNDTLDKVTLYIEGSANVSGNPSKTYKDGWQVSLITERNLSIQGNIRFTPNDSKGSYGGMNHLFMVAGGDLQISGNVTHVGSEGLYLAHEQIELTGSSTLKGLVVAENAITSSNNPDLTSGNNISGNTYLSNELGCNDAFESTTYALSVRSLVETQ